MKYTQLQQKANSMKITSETVRDHLKFEEIEYNTILFNLGVQFLEKMFGADTDEYRVHSRSKLFWSWYRIQFDQCASSYLRHTAVLSHVQNMRVEILMKLFINDMTFFCLDSNGIQKAFKNYEDAFTRYRERSRKTA